MRPSPRTTLSLAYVLLLAPAWTRAQDAGRAPRFYVELEPLQFFSGGYSVVGHVAVGERWQVGANVFASELGEGLSDLAFAGVDDDLALGASQDLGVNVSARYFFRPGHRGWVASLPVGYETWTLADEDTGREIDGYEFWYLGPRVGYLWYPFARQGLYVLGEAVAILPLARDAPAALSGRSVEIRSFVPLPGLGIGWRF